ncbi:hypothetical protein CP01DC11_1175, partial [Chlamydia psittaci 01DC11]
MRFHLFYNKFGRPTLYLGSCYGSKNKKCKNQINIS